MKKFLAALAAFFIAMILCVMPVHAYEDINGEIEEGEKALLAILVMAEAGNQDMTGKKLVVDTVLNRVDDPAFPNTVTEVIYQPYQFSPIKDGGFEKAFWTVNEDCFKAVEMEWGLSKDTRTDSQVIYFCSNGYSSYGTPLYRYGGHYFSGK